LRDSVHQYKSSKNSQEKQPKEITPGRFAGLRPVPCAPRLSRALRNSPESKNDSGSNSARALLRLKLRCSASSDGGTSKPTAISGAIHFVHCALRGLALLIISFPGYLAFNWDYVVLFLVIGGAAIYLQSIVWR